MPYFLTSLKTTRLRSFLSNFLSSILTVDNVLRFLRVYTMVRDEERNLIKLSCDIGLLYKIKRTRSRRTGFGDLVVKVIPLINNRVTALVLPLRESASCWLTRWHLGKKAIARIIYECTKLGCILNIDFVSVAM